MTNFANRLRRYYLTFLLEFQYFFRLFRSHRIKFRISQLIFFVLTFDCILFGAVFQNQRAEYQQNNTQSDL